MHSPLSKHIIPCSIGLFTLIWKGEELQYVWGYEQVWFHDRQKMLTPESAVNFLVHCLLPYTYYGFAPFRMSVNKPILHGMICLDNGECIKRYCSDLEKIWRLDVEKTNQAIGQIQVGFSVQRVCSTFPGWPLNNFRIAQKVWTPRLCGESQKRKSGVYSIPWGPLHSLH